MVLNSATERRFWLHAVNQMDIPAHSLTAQLPVCVWLNLRGGAGSCLVLAGGHPAQELRTSVSKVSLERLQGDGQARGGCADVQDRLAALL